MNPYLLSALVVLALAATGQYFLGTKRNRAIAATISKGAEEVLKPKMTNYVNIGGAIGHNFTYSLAWGHWTNAKGTMTLSPRHSLLYLPVSRILGLGVDRFYLSLFTKKKLRGEGHVVLDKELRRARISGIEDMERREVEAGGRRFVLLWRGDDLSEALEATLTALPEPARLRHFCCYGENKTFFLKTHPVKGEVAADLRALLPRLESFFDRKEKA